MWLLYKFFNGKFVTKRSHENSISHSFASKNIWLLVFSCEGSFSSQPTTARQTLPNPTSTSKSFQILRRKQRNDRWHHKNTCPRIPSADDTQRSSVDIPRRRSFGHFSRRKLRCGIYALSDANTVPCAIWLCVTDRSDDFRKYFYVISLSDADYDTRNDWISQ